MGAGQSGGPEIGGFRVFKVHPESPASEAGLEVFFDFILEINGTPMDSDQQTFAKKVIEVANTRAKMTVFNIRSGVPRDVYMTPRRWGGSGLLGAVVRYDTLGNVENQGIRVLEVFPQSPAQEAGIIPFKDFLLGTAEVMFRDLDELSQVVTLRMNEQMSLIVYNSDTEAIREVIITPRLGWGGEGCLGADIRTGLLHRIPAPRRQAPLSGPLPSAAQAAAAAAALPEQPMSAAAAAAAASRQPTAAMAYLAALQGAAAADAEGEAGCDAAASGPASAAVRSLAPPAAAASPRTQFSAAEEIAAERAKAAAAAAAVEGQASSAAAAAGLPPAAAAGAAGSTAYAAAVNGQAAPAAPPAVNGGPHHGGAPEAAAAPALVPAPAAPAVAGHGGFAGAVNGAAAAAVQAVDNVGCRPSSELPCEVPDPGVIYELRGAK